MTSGISVYQAAIGMVLSSITVLYKGARESEDCCLCESYMRLKWDCYDFPMHSIEQIGAAGAP